MTTGMMTKLNITLTEINEMTFHEFQARYRILIKMMEPEKNNG